MNVLVTAGGTVAPIDDVRQITNASTGRLGAAIAEAALHRGATVWYLHTQAALRPFDRLACFDLETPDAAAEIHRLAVLRAEWLAVRGRYHAVALPTGSMAEYVTRFRTLVAEVAFDVAFLAMAASDYAPEPTAGKLASDADELVIRCRRAPKLIAEARTLAPAAYLVGFKLLSGAPLDDLIRVASVATVRNQVDLTVANDLRTVRAGQHTLHLVRPGRPVETLAPPEPIADRLVDRVLGWAGERGRRT